MLLLFRFRRMNREGRYLVLECHALRELIVRFGLSVNGGMKDERKQRTLLASSQFFSSSSSDRSGFAFSFGSSFSFQSFFLFFLSSFSGFFLAFLEDRSVL